MIKTISKSNSLDVLHLFKKTVEMYKNDWKTIFVSIYKIILIFFIFQIIMNLSVFVFLFIPLIGEIFSNIISFILGSILSALMMLQFFNAIKQYIEKKSFPGTISYLKELFNSKKWINLAIFELFISILIIIVIVGGAILGIFGIIGLSGFQFSEETLNFQTILLMVAIVLLILIIFSIIYVLLFFAIPACAFYEKNFIEMIKKSINISLQNIKQIILFYIIIIGINALTILIVVSPLLIAGFSSSVAWIIFAALALLALIFYIFIYAPWSTLFTYTVQYELSKLYGLEKSK